MTDLDIIDAEWVEVQEQDYSWFDDPEYLELKQNFKAMRSRELNWHGFEIGWDPRDHPRPDTSDVEQPSRAKTIVVIVAVAALAAWLLIAGVW